MLCSASLQNACNFMGETCEAMRYGSLRDLNDIAQYVTHDLIIPSWFEKGRLHYIGKSNCSTFSKQEGEVWSATILLLHLYVGLLALSA